MSGTKRAPSRAQSKKSFAAKLAETAMSQADLLAPLAAAAALPDPFLGQAHAVVIASACAQTSPTNLPRTLAQLGVNGIPFQRCVFNGVDQLGYSIPLDNIPDAPTNTLLDVVNTIQNAPRKA